MTNRDRPASTLTKREHAALEILTHLHNFDPESAVGMADALFDELDTPTELRDEPLWRPEDHP